MTEPETELAMVKSPKLKKETSNSDDHNLELGSTIETYDRKAESKMLRKFNFFAVIPLGVFYMMAILDRSNLGNANIAGMPEDIGLTGNQFGTATTLLYATYVPFEAPISVLVKSVGPKILISASAFCWGASTLGMAFITNYKGLYVCHLLMGLFEAGLIPASEVYMALVYNRTERGRRMSLFYTFSCLASTFGGLLAYGLTQINGPNGFEGWRWLFSVEAAITIILVPLFYFVFPKTPVDAWFLTDEEKRIVRARYDNDPHWAFDEKFSWVELGKVFTDIKFYAFFVYQFSINLTQFGFTTFLLTIISGLGYTSINANLMTVPIYLSALAVFLVIAFASDRYGMRGPFMAGPALLILIGLILLVSVENLNVRFAACFLSAFGLYPAAALSMMWLQDNVAGFYKRSSMVGFTLTLANTAGVVVGQIFTADDKPYYKKGLSICLGFSVLAILIVLALMTGMKIVNRRREAAIREADAVGSPLPREPEKGDYDVYFRYTI
ncbi:hypothetical protein N7463_010707 [Penicillium fimorum]|uniref:Major facilitator superfamily (MFS) profile domain-containing protein n=1 Tax=Penicillium fimorum TaxID=1882269 RepID=A0A9X0C1Y6_9EURO|nr:hypothetical protein N7463_010707 [Penicillium fimorum]